MQSHRDLCLIFFCQSDWISAAWTVCHSFLAEVTVQEYRPHQFCSSECLSLFADDETIFDSQFTEQLSPSCHITVCLHIAGTQQDPIIAWWKGNTTVSNTKVYRRNINKEMLNLVTENVTD